AELGKTSTTSPLTRKFPFLKSAVVLEYRLCTSCFRNLVREMTWSLRMDTTFFLNSTGLPIPYRQDTEATTITSRRPESREEVVLNRSFSISSLMERSFSI